MGGPMYGGYRLSLKEKIVFAFCVLATPLFIVLNPFSFLIGYRLSLTPTETPEVFEPHLAKFYFAAFTIYLIIILWKYPFYALKKGMVQERYSPPRYYIAHCISQLPYLMLIKQYPVLWESYRDTGFFGFVGFPWFLSFFIISYFISCVVYNGIVFSDRNR